MQYLTHKGGGKQTKYTTENLAISINIRFISVFWYHKTGHDEPYNSQTSSRYKCSKQKKVSK